MTRAACSLALLAACSAPTPAPAPPAPPVAEVVAPPPAPPATAWCASPLEAPPTLASVRAHVLGGGGPCVLSTAEALTDDCPIGAHQQHGNLDRELTARRCTVDGEALEELLTREPDRLAMIRVERAAALVEATLDPYALTIAVARTPRPHSVDYRGLVPGHTGRALLRWSDLRAVDIVGDPHGVPDWNGNVLTTIYTPSVDLSRWRPDAPADLAALSRCDPRGAYLIHPTGSFFEVRYDLSNPKQPRPLAWRLTGEEWQPFGGGTGVDPC